MTEKKAHKPRLTKQLLKEKIFKKRRLLIVLAVLVLLSIIGYYTLGLQVKFILEEEMYLDLVPLEASYTVPYTGSAAVNFTLLVDRPSVCSFTCDHIFKDLSTGEIIDTKTTSSKEVFSSYALSVDTVGEGQHLYNYQVVCHNVKSNFCSTSEKNYFKSALISVNYELPEQEALAKAQTETLLQTILDQALLIEEDLLYGKALAASLSIDSSFQNLSMDLSRRIVPLEQAWESQQFVVLQNALDASVNDTLTLIAQATQEEISRIELLRDESLAASTLLAQLSNASFLQPYADLFANTSYETSFQDFLVAVNQTIQNNYSFTNVTVYEQFLADVDVLRAEFDFVQAEYVVRQNAQRQEIQQQLTNQQQLYAYLNISRAIEAATCDEVRKENFYVFAHNTSARNEQLQLAPNLPVEFFTNLSTEYLSAMNSSMYWFPYTNITTGNTTTDFSTLSLKDLVSLLFFPEISIPSCDQNATLPQLANWTELVFTNVTPQKVTQTPLTNHEPLCCFEGDCFACCTGETCQDIYPVVFVHGHALSINNRPEESHSAFGKIQRLLEEEGYVNAGQLGADSAFSIPAGDWGRVPAPVAIRLSYYIISYVDVGSYQIATQKTDKIENYAIRLKDLIETVKYRTGKDKVNIVAHSMGGLVSREYIALFGEDSVNKFIMVGTPNLGVDKQTQRLCSLAGASRECEDMYENSIFMKRLNVPENAFDSIAGYTIRGIGCDTNGVDGDGVVRASAVPLNYTTNFVIEGECTDALESDLHINMLDPELYPETYEIIRAILVN